MEARTQWVDYAKAIGILLVVYGHVARGLYNAGINIHPTFYAITDSIIYSFHMPLFFFLAGLFFSNSFQKQGASKLVFSKIDTIVYPFMLWSILQGSIEVVLANYTNGELTFGEVFSLFWSPRGQFWFLYALFVAFWLAAVVYSIVSPRATGAIFVGAALLYIVQDALPRNLLLWFIADNFVFFVMGIGFTRYYKRKALGRTWALYSLGIAFIVSQYIFHKTLGLHYLDKGLFSLALAFIGILLVVSVSRRAALNPQRFIVFIGTSSMAIYLMHILAGSGARIVLGKVMGIDSVTVHLVVGCMVGVLAPLAAAEMIRRFRIPFVFAAPLSAPLFYVYTLAFRHAPEKVEDTAASKAVDVEFVTSADLGRELDPEPAPVAFAGIGSLDAELESDVENAEPVPFPIADEPDTKA